MGIIEARTEITQQLIRDPEETPSLFSPGKVENFQILLRDLVRMALRTTGGRDSVLNDYNYLSRLGDTSLALMDMDPKDRYIYSGEAYIELYETSRLWRENRPLTFTSYGMHCLVETIEGRDPRTSGHFVFGLDEQPTSFALITANQVLKDVSRTEKSWLKHPVDLLDAGVNPVLVLSAFIINAESYPYGISTTEILENIGMYRNLRPSLRFTRYDVADFEETPAMVKETDRLMSRANERARLRLKQQGSLGYKFRKKAFDMSGLWRGFVDSLQTSEADELDLEIHNRTIPRIIGSLTPDRSFE